MKLGELAKTAYNSLLILIYPTLYQFIIITSTFIITLHISSPLLKLNVLQIDV